MLSFDIDPLLYSWQFLYLQDSQVELVLLIFRRLAEDIHVFESDLPSKRKKEMSTALSENISDIFAFLIQNLEVGVQFMIKMLVNYHK